MADSQPDVASFFAAIEAGDLEAVRGLLAGDANLIGARGERPPWSGKCTGLQIAADTGNLEMVRLLVEAGADVKDRGSLTGWAPLHLAHKNREIASYLITRGAQVDIHAAAGLGDLSAVKEMVEGDAGAVHRRGPDGATPLCFAATVEIAVFLLDHGADMEARDEDHGMTPVAWVADNRELVRFLLARGASVGDPFLAAAVGAVEKMREFLDADPSLVRAGTPEGDFYGAGATLLHIAAGKGHAEVAGLLLERGAAASAIGGWYEVTPLHWAAQGGWLEAARELVKHGADLSIRDSRHDGTPLGWARFFEREEIVELLTRKP